MVPANLVSTGSCAKSTVEVPVTFAELLRGLGVDVGLHSSSDKTIVARMLAAGLGGVFYVPDAAATTDASGRKIIAAQEFVRAQKAKAVFGVPGNYFGGL